jgi:N-acetylglucosamine-6-phosphate deacetylase
MIISAPQVFIDGRFNGPTSLVIEDGLITAVIPGIAAKPDISLEHGFLSPGLIDLHNKGAFGVDFSAASAAQWDYAIAELGRHGVTSLLPTIITAPFAELRAAAGRVRQAMQSHPGIIGLHLEGPFLAPQKAGAHRADWLQAFSEGSVADLLALPGLAMVTLAPELPGAIAVIRRLVQAGVSVSLGHTAASAAKMQEAAGAGARLVTHVFNAQSPLNHRAPGPAGVALTDPRLFPCLIADGLHVDPLILQLAFAANPRAIAVTDSIPAAGMEEGFEAEFGGAKLTLHNGIARRPDGTIAGAAITLDEGIRRLIAAGIPPETALAAATERPAEAIRLYDRGRIAVGRRADLIWWNPDFFPAQVWRGGKATAPIAPPRGTEAARPELHDLDMLPTHEIVARFLAQEAAAQRALQTAAPDLAALADAIALRLQGGGRLFYAGAGTSGRMALLDAVESGPTFGVGEETIIPLLAGGPSAFLHAIEGAEDDATAAIGALKAHKFCGNDALVGIAASGQTPFTLAAIAHANACGALTGAIVNNLATPIGRAAQIAIEIVSGPEIIAGSTRLSAGTTQKIALNILSSTVMIRLGKTYGPYMVDLRATNEKLKKRAIRMTAALGNVAEPEAAAALADANMHIKTAVVMLRLGVTAGQAADALRQSNGNLRRALTERPDAGSG